MRTILFMFQLGLACHLLLTAMPAFPSDLHLGMDLAGSYNSQANYLDRGDWGLIGERHFSKDRTFGRLSAAPYCAITLSKNISGFVQADLAWACRRSPWVPAW